MSKFIDSVEASFTGKRAPYPLRASLEKIDLDSPRISLMNQYNVGVSFVRVINCEPKHVPAAINAVIRELRHIIYEDMFNLIYCLERAVISQDDLTILSTLRDILREVGK